MNAKRTEPHRNREGGFSIILALFVIVVVALLGAVAVRVGAGEQQTVTLRVLSDRAVEAARTGIEWGAYRALDLATCGAGTLALTEGALNGFSVSITCAVTPHTVSGISYSVWEIEAYSESGTYGRPDYVSRRIGARFSDAP